ANPNATPARIIPKSTATGYPEKYELYQNYPNPFNPSTMIEFDLPVASTVTLKVYNLLGQEVATLLNNQLVEEGAQAVEFNAANYPSGVYFYRINVESVDEDGVASTFTQIMKMMLMK
ncbi:MAG: T9SS type A sorting domain-containing protein, partial [Bacteroidetes bacterium]